MRVLLLVAVALAPVPARASAQLAAVHTTGASGFGVVRGDPLAGWFEEGLGAAQVTLDARRRLTAEARLSLPSGNFRVTLEAEAAEAAWSLPVHGGTGWGVAGGVPALAAVALSGQGRLWRDGVELGAAAVQVLVLSAGTHADDSTHALLPAARPGDAELEWVVQGPSGGVLRLFFDELEGEVRGQPFRDEAVVPQPAAAAPNVGLSALTSPVASPRPPASGGIGVAEGTVRALNARPASPLPATPSPANAQAASPLPRAVEVGAAQLFVPLAQTPTPINALAPPAPVGPPSSSVVPGQLLPGGLPIIPSVPMVR